MRRGEFERSRDLSLHKLISPSNHEPVREGWGIFDQVRYQDRAASPKVYQKVKERLQHSGRACLFPCRYLLCSASIAIVDHGGYRGNSGSCGELSDLFIIIIIYLVLGGF